ncbi:MAG: hypothetical protein QY332_11950 [Anaerolineales bacterium]|nr:MAG: hypothetical protein QY332_11950 [Anaerolineales bacterium]
MNHGEQGTKGKEQGEEEEKESEAEGDEEVMDKPAPQSVMIKGLAFLQTIQI